jgi:hypothetical protein
VTRLLGGLAVSICQLIVQCAPQGSSLLLAVGGGVLRGCGQKTRNHIRGVECSMADGEAE